jgi:uncharacterized protein YdiU (UPF0061 family)
VRSIGASYRNARSLAVVVAPGHDARVPALEALRFDNRLLREMPADPDTINRTRQVVGAAYSRVQPTGVAGPALVAHSSEVAALIGLDESEVHTPAFAQVFGGNALASGMEPYATAYGGHQFGSWARQLGDGRAIALGEVVHDGKRWELQLKGAGPTPYSRRGDGRAVLRSSVREFLCSEAMHHLGVPTTRALSLVTTGDEVMRDMLYDGHPEMEPGAVVCRAAPSFIRFGHFELPASREDSTLLRRWVEHTIRGHFPQLVDGGDGPIDRDVILSWVREVGRRTALMSAHWMRVGFVHGVMNTDNMSVLGLTIDYGPYGWLEGFDPGWTPNTTDAQGRRYRFGAQPQVALWNLARFAEALLPLVDDVEAMTAALDPYADTFEAEHGRMQAHKLGLPDLGEDGDALIGSLMKLLTAQETDMTIFYRALAQVQLRSRTEGDGVPEPLRAAFYDEPTHEQGARLDAWLGDYAATLDRAGVDEPTRAARMNRANPKYVLRNYMAQLAIDDAQGGDPSLVNELLDLLRRPYDEQPERERWFARRPEWARHRAGCSMLSCSS